MRHSKAADMSKSLSSSVAPGLVSRAASKTMRTMGMRPMSRHRRVMPLSYLSKIGMMTTSLMTSHMSMTPAKSPTSRLMRSTWAAAISALSRSSSQSAVTVCQASGWPLTVWPRSASHRAAARTRSVSGLPRSGSKRPQ